MQMHLCNSCTKSVGQGDKRRTGNSGVHLLLNKVFLAKKGKLKSRFIETKNESLSRNYVQFCKSNLHSVASRVEVSTNSPCLTVTETDNEIRLSKSLFTSLTFCSVRWGIPFSFLLLLLHHYCCSLQRQLLAQENGTEEKVRTVHWALT